jgi:hypothetical protein
VGEVLIEGRRLDVKEGLDFSFNYSIADVRDPNKRSTEYSKTIQCPSTPGNDELFGNIWDVNISNPYNSTDLNVEVDFNPNKKAEARVVSDGVEVMVGVVQLRSITIVSGKMDYEVVFIGNLISFFGVIGKSKLREEIDFSDLDHDYTTANVQNSWTAGLDYVYPMIDYGDEFNTELGTTSWLVRQFRPALFAKSIIDRIFDYAGFTYTSSFIDSDPFTSLIIPFSGEQIFADDSQTNNRKFQASLSAPDGAYVAGDFTSINSEVSYRTLQLDNDSTNGNFDTGNNWSTSTFRYLVPNDGYYGFSVSQNITLERTTVNANRIYGGSVNIHLQIIKADVALNESIIGETIQTYSLVGNPSSFNQTLELTTDCEEQLMFAGDKIQFRFLVNFNDFTATNLTGQSIAKSNLFTDFDMTTDSSTGLNAPSNLIFEGDTMVMNSVVPDVTMNELIMSFARMFNWYITQDPLNENNLIIEPRDEYYASGIIRDWNKKLARDRRSTIKPMGLLSAKVYDYKYKEDSDYYNERYQTSYQRTYGNRRYEVDNDFLNDIKDVEVIFSPTPMQIEGNTDRFIARIYDNDISEGAKPTEANIRVLYYDYLPCDIWKIKSELSGGSSTILTNYPYAGHLDNPITPSLDINFGIPFELFYQANASTGTLQYTNANLYNVYHRKHIEEITNKDSKMLIGEFYLTAFDIEKLDFRDQIIVDNAYWRINRIMDYNPFKEGLTKVELFKVLDVVQTEVDVFTVGSIGSVGTGSDNELKPNVGRKAKQLSQYNSYNGKVNGSKNTVSPNAKNFKVIGSENFIGDSSRNVSIIGDGNYVASGLENVVIINSDNQEVYESNITIIEGKLQWRYVDVKTTYTATDREFVLADATSAGFTVTLPSLEANIWVAIKKTDSTGNAVTIATVGSETIDGALTLTLPSQYDSVDLYCNGKNWFIR